MKTVFRVQSKEPGGMKCSPGSSPALRFPLYPEHREEARKASGSGLTRLGVCSRNSTRPQEELEVAQPPQRIRRGEFLGVGVGTALRMTPWCLTECWEDGRNLPEKPAAEGSSAVHW